MVVSGVVLAAGEGRRFGGTSNKVWCVSAGKPLVGHALGSLGSCGLVDELVLVLRSEDAPLLGEFEHVLNVPLKRVVGGARRQDSARLGVRAARGDYVLVHDGARPLVSHALVRAVLEAARRHGAAVPTLPVVDTLRYVDDGGFVKAEGPTREGLVHMQTPQGFRRALLLEAYEEAERAGRSLPDDATAVLAIGHPVAAIAGDPANVKVTTPCDLELVARLLSQAPSSAPQ